MYSRLNEEEWMTVTVLIMPVTIWGRGCAPVLINDNFMQISPFNTLVPKGPSCFERLKTPTHSGGKKSILFTHSSLSLKGQEVVWSQVHLAAEPEAGVPRLQHCRCLSRPLGGTGGFAARARLSAA